MGSTDLDPIPDQEALLAALEELVAEELVAEEVVAEGEEHDSAGDRKPFAAVASSRNRDHPVQEEEHRLEVDCLAAESEECRSRHAAA